MGNGSPADSGVSATERCADQRKRCSASSQVGRLRALCYAGDETVRITSRQQGVARELLLVKSSSRPGRSLAYAGSRQEGADVNEAGGSSVPEPIPQAAPGGFAAAEPLPDLI